MYAEDVVADDVIVRCRRICWRVIPVFEYEKWMKKWNEKVLIKTTY